VNTDTTSTTLTYLFWELTKHPEWQNRIQKELQGFAGNADGGKSEILKGTETPILEAVINEALRLHPAAPASLPRSVPAGGVQLSSYDIPEDVSCFRSDRSVVI
jgi:cytochrome P450